MQVKPLQYHPQSASGHLTLDHTIFDTDANFVIAIPCMEMRRSMVLKVHKDDNSVKCANLWHML